MSNTQQEQSTGKPKTLIGKLLSLPFTIFGILCGSLILSIIIECLGVYLFWQDQGWHHAETMFFNEIDNFSNTFTQSLMVNNPLQRLNDLLSFCYEWLFIKTGLVEQLNAIITPKATDSAAKLSIRNYMSIVATESQTYLLAAAYTTLTFIVRVMILILSMPLILLAVLVGLIDGLVKRDLRRFVAGHESGFIYHRARGFIKPTIALPWVVYLALPFSIAPLWIMLPCALFAGIVMNITAASFKKYL